MYNIDPIQRLSIVHHHIDKGVSLRETARLFHVNYQTVFKWVKLFKEQGLERLYSTYIRSGRRASEELEEKVVLLKERNPTLTIRKTRDILGNNGIRISLKGIWGIWKRYGYAGFDRDSFSSDFTDYVPWSAEARKKYNQAKELYDSHTIEKSAKVLNSIPILPPNILILKIPDSYLNIRRQVEKIYLQWGQLTIPSYQKKSRKLFEKCIEDKLNYLALKAGIIEIGALVFTKEPGEMLKKTGELKKILRRQGDYYSNLLFGFKFSLLCRDGFLNASLLKIREVYGTARMCCRMLKGRKKIAPFFSFNLASLYDHLQDHKKAESWYLKTLDRMEHVPRVLEVNKKEVRYHLARIYFLQGKYKKAFQFLKDARLSTWNFWGIPAAGHLHQAMWFLVNGERSRAVSIATDVISRLRKEDVNTYLDSAYLLIACTFCSLGDHAKAVTVLKRLLPFLVKTRRKRVESNVRIILSKYSGKTHHVHPDKELVPTIKLVVLLRNGRYQEAFNYAEKKGIMFFLHRYIFFFPELVDRLIEKGKPTGLPKAMLRLPVFNKEIPVYNLRFLGNLVVHKNQRYLKSKLGPKDTAFLIHFALRAGDSGKSIPLKDLYDNFWRNNPNQTRHLSHLLMRIKKALNIPVHLLEIISRKENPVLINRGIHFSTDYQEFEQILAGAKAFQRAEQWGFAKKEYSQAFRLFRGEPFKKMYDDWSENRRVVILNKLETEAIHFANGCFEHGDRRTTKKTLGKITKIIPDSFELIKVQKYGMHKSVM